MPGSDSEISPLSRSLVLVGAVAIFGGFLFGYDTAVINGANQYLKIHFALDSVGEGTAGASAIFGCIPGAMLAGWFSDRSGRKNVLFVCALLFALSGIMSALPSTFTEFLVARFVSGVAIGASSMVCPVYIAEMAPKSWRGRFGSLFQFGIVIGIFITLFINADIQSMGDETWNATTGWRWMLAAEILPAIFLLGTLIFVAESPRWLVQAGRAAAAQRVLEGIGGESFARKEIGTIESAFDQESGRLGELFSSKFRRPLIISVVLMAISQLSGINAIMYYSTRIFTTAGVGIKNSFTATTTIGLINVLFTLVAVMLIDKAGRRALLLAGLSAQVLALGAVSWMLHAGLHGGVLLVAVVSFIAAFAIGLGPIPWIMCSEIFPNRVRGRAMSVATFVIWTSCYLVAQTFPILNDNPRIGPALTFSIFASFSLLGLAFVWFCVPETKNRSLEDIETLWTQI